MLPIIGLLLFCVTFALCRRMNATSICLEDALKDMKDAAREVFGRHCSDIESSSSDSSEEGPSDGTGLKEELPALQLSTENATHVSSSTGDCLMTSKGKRKRLASKFKMVSTDGDNSSSCSSEESSCDDSSLDSLSLNAAPSRTKRLLNKPKRKVRRKSGSILTGTRTSRKCPHKSTDSDSPSEESSPATLLRRHRFSDSVESEQKGKAVSVDSVCATPTGTRRSQRLAQRTATPNYREDKMFS